ncbi:MAG: hypothetical protein IPP31_13345 [Chitinophagaceae bacterium]|nr:hypothetical protein [Chitinophagaceae bacterium]
MKKITLSLILSFLSLILFAQPVTLVKKWHATVQSADGSPAAEDRARQMNTLDIIKKTGDHIYTGMVEYNQGGKLITTPCTITTNGKEISIATTEQNWSGTILKSNDEVMNLRMGSLDYFFKKVLVPVQRPQQAAKFKAEQFYGNWLETARFKTKEMSAIPIGTKDTFYLRLSKENAMLLPGTANAPMNGSMDITKGDNLNIATSDFKVVSLTGELMVLDDYENTSHTFTRTMAPFAFENKSTFCAGCKVDLSESALVRTWFVNSIAPMSASKKEDAISTLEITAKNADNSYSGFVEYGNWTEKAFKKSACTLTFTGNDLSITGGIYTWTGRVYLCTGDSLIFGREKEIMYYFKKQVAATTPAVDPGNNMIDLRPESVKHNWSGFNPEAAPGFIKPEMGILRELNLRESAGNMKYKGTVLFDRLNKRQRQDCTIEFSGDAKTSPRIKIITEGYSWDIELFKADGKELIMGRKTDGIRYSFKRMD